MSYDDEYRYGRGPAPDEPTTSPRKRVAPGKRTLTQSLPPRPVQLLVNDDGEMTLAGAIGSALDLFATKSVREQLKTLRESRPARQVDLLAQVPESRKTWLLRALEPLEQASLLAAMDRSGRQWAMETLGEATVANALEVGLLTDQTVAGLLVEAPPTMQMDLLLALAYVKRYAPIERMPSWQLGQILDGADDESLRMLVAPMPVEVLAPLFAQMVPARQARVQALLPRESETALALHPAATAPVPGDPVQRWHRSGSEVGEWVAGLTDSSARSRPPFSLTVSENFSTPTRRTSSSTMP